MYKNILIWLLISLFYAYQYVLRVLPNIISPKLITKFNIGVTDIGQFAGIYYIGYTLAHIPVGLAIDRFGIKFVLPICMILTCTGSLPLILSDTWYYAIFGRIVVGIGSSAAAIGIFKVANLYFPQEKSPRMTSISMIIGMLGAIYGGLSCHFLFNTFGWNNVLYIFSVLGSILAISIFILTPVHNIQNSIVNIQDLKTIILNKRIILISLCSGLMIGPIQGFSDGWAQAFFLEIYKIDIEMANFMSSLILIGMLIGSLALSYLLEIYKNKHYEITIACALTMILSFILLFTQMRSFYIVLPILFIIGFSSGYQVITIYKALSYVTHRLLGITTAISNMIIMCFGFLFHTGIAHIINHSWNRTIIQGMPVYSPELLIKAISIIPICLLVAFFILLWLYSQEHKP
ncbi:MFS transporter [Wolbachia endosymbiont of Howardula sp.]|uniref:MFS transporter n=1 Tax=Wolbachia endosymbiont of Howardula sp. TaxID=2916816 RepID=UPI00217DA0F1|nr:MFS transporter [Wolbachia endosymbiont of Howardula sp.]UWI83208.1 MFS transporter [Wolbachia endosymbiont of Howardula sp.]